MKCNPPRLASGAFAPTRAVDLRSLRGTANDASAMAVSGPAYIVPRDGHPCLDHPLAGETPRQGRTYPLNSRHGWLEATGGKRLTSGWVPSKKICGKFGRRSCSAYRETRIIGPHCGSSGNRSRTGRGTADAVMAPAGNNRLKHLARALKTMAPAGGTPHARRQRASPASRRGQIRASRTTASASAWLEAIKGKARSSARNAKGSSVHPSKIACAPRRSRSAHTCWS